jgi:hypothetical protein
MSWGLARVPGKRSSRVLAGWCTPSADENERADNGLLALLDRGVDGLPID